jgi:trehalose-6-phosphate synthase
MMLEKMFAEKMKQRVNMPLDKHEFKKQIMYTRINKHDTQTIFNELRHRNLIKVDKGRVWLR